MTSFEEFCAAQATPLLGLARALARDGHDAWDLTQETLARVAERWRRLDADPLADPAAYARTVMVRLNIDRVRRLRRELLRASPEETPADLIATVAEGPDAWLLEALATLSPRQRTALALRFVCDLDLAVVAARMGCSVGTAKSHLSRGTERLRAHAPARPVRRPQEETR